MEKTEQLKVWYSIRRKSKDVHTCSGSSVYVGEERGGGDIACVGTVL
jgi:hypothetical protein